MEPNNWLNKSTISCFSEDITPNFHQKSLILSRHDQSTQPRSISIEFYTLFLVLKS